MIDEATAVGSSQESHALRRYGYLWAGLSVFVLWNFMARVGVALLSGTGTLIEDLGIDATIPAAFLGLVWPKFSSNDHRKTRSDRDCHLLLFWSRSFRTEFQSLQRLQLLFSRPWNVEGDDE